MSVCTPCRTTVPCYQSSRLRDFDASIPATHSGIHPIHLPGSGGAHLSHLTDSTHSRILPKAGRVLVSFPYPAQRGPHALHARPSSSDSVREASIAKTVWE